MRMSIAKDVSQRVSDAPAGKLFINSDFSDLGEPATVRRNLNRLVEGGALRRIANGLYEKPKYSSFLGEAVAASPDAIAHTIARNYHWTISPCGNTALNLLGLSEQVPVIWSYVSDGPYRKYKLSDSAIEFRHRTNKEITGLTEQSLLLIQAIKALGKGNVTENTIQILSKKYTEPEKQQLLKETSESTDWIFSVIKQICTLGGA